MNIYIYVIVGMFASFLLCIATILFYLKYKKNILQKQYQLKAAELQYQKDLLKAIINSQEDERKRIGMDLHDEVGSTLSSLRLLVDTVFDEKKENDLSAAYSRKFKNTIDDVVFKVRNISHNLSPILSGAYEFYDAVLDFCDDINHAGKIEIHTSIQENAENIQLEHFTKLSLYRVIAELINNTIKHAEAQNITIDFSLVNNEYKIEYKDDGKGLLVNEKTIRKGIGFKNMESRLDSIDAKYSMESRLTTGFQMNIYLPVKN
ncbi:sensor histidine kinase [Arachidicoccus sp.]|uniref:sensor histidine kinase n=1 Tax=Arachidicoccus sp. TaxID=1872624 RepID=UPI003D1A4A39